MAKNFLEPPKDTNLQSRNLTKHQIGEEESGEGKKIHDWTYWEKKTSYKDCKGSLREKLSLLNHCEQHFLPRGPGVPPGPHSCVKARHPLATLPKTQGLASRSGHERHSKVYHQQIMWFSSNCGTPKWSEAGSIRELLGGKTDSLFYVHFMCRQMNPEGKPSNEQRKTCFWT